MKNSIWRPPWWVFLPVMLPVAAFVWFRLGAVLQLQHSSAPMAGSANYPAWVFFIYGAVQHGLWIFLSPGGLVIVKLIDASHGNINAVPVWVFWVGLLVSIAIDCLFLYGMLMVVRWAGRPGYVKE